jgi:hypothetical protein
LFRLLLRSLFTLAVLLLLLTVYTGRRLVAEDEAVLRGAWRHRDVFVVVGLLLLLNLFLARG